MARRARPLQFAKVKAAGGARGGAAGWAVLAVAAALGVAGAAASPEALLLGVPTVAEGLAVAAAVVGLAAAAGRALGRPGLGLAPLLVLIAVSRPAFPSAALTGGPLLALAGAVAVSALAATRPAWARPAFVPVMLALHLAGAARAQTQVGPQGDEPHYLMAAHSLIADGDLALDGDYASGRYRAFHPPDLEPHYRVRGKDGAIYSLHAVGLSILVLPAYAVGGYAGASFFMALLGAATAWQVRALVRDALGDDGLADAAGWIIGASPPLLHFAGLVFTEVPAALGLTVALRFSLDAESRPRALAGGVIVALLPWLNVRYAILAAVVLAAAVARKAEPRRAAAWIAPGVVSAAAIALFHHALYGFFDPRRVYGRRPEFALDVVPAGLPGLLLDQEFGLLVYAPVFALAAPGLVRLARSRPLAAASCGALIAAVVAVAAAWPMWRGGFNPPARFLLPVLPALAVGVAAWLARGPTFPAALLVGWGLWTGLAGTVDRATVHRDRDGTAPLFRAHSGAVEWTTLLPGFVLDETARDRAALAAIWTAALAAAAAARRAVSPGSVALTSAGLVIACAAAQRASGAGSGGRDAVRVIGRPAIALPAGPVVRGEAGWTTRLLDWGPAYEPHRHPSGAVLGARLPLPAGEYEVLIRGGEPPSGLAPPVLHVAAGRHPVPSQGLAASPEGLRGRFALPAPAAVTLSLAGGRPLIVNEIRVRHSTFSAATGPTS
jgi:hypothetical protein